VLSRETEEAETGRAGAATRNGLRSWPAADAPEEEEERGIRGCVPWKREEKQ
jgi:hypothetical protein